MKKALLFVMMAVAAVVFTGCASVNVAGTDKLNGEQLSYTGKAQAHIQAENWGIYLFMIPLITGDTANPGKTVFLQDTVTVPQVCKLMAAEAKKQGAKYTLNVVSAPATNPWFFGIKEVHVSANLVK